MQNETNIDEDNTFRSCDDLKEFLWRRITDTGIADIGGVEEEVIVLRQNGKPLTWKEFQSVISEIVLSLPNGSVIRDCDIWGNDMVKGGSSSIGKIQPETNSALLEFAHAPVSDSWQLKAQSKRFLNSLMRVAKDHKLIVLGAGMMPSLEWNDFYSFDAVMPHVSFPYSWEHMKNRTRMEYCRTVFGTASIHHSFGFNDPELLARYYATVLRMQPTMISLIGNAPLWNFQRAVDSDGRPLLSLRGYVQLDYGKTFGKQGDVYLYPAQVLEPGVTFEKLVDFYLDSPLDRTYVSGEKAYVGALTMRQYVERGIQTERGTVFPDSDAINMMFRTPMMDVRLSMIDAPRVEARSHDNVSHSVTVALDAFYRGIANNLDEAQAFISGISVEETRRQRRQVCYSGLQTPVKHRLPRIRSQRDVAAQLLLIAQQGLVARKLGEEELLAPLFLIEEENLNPAQKFLHEIEENSSSIDMNTIGHSLNYANRYSFERGADFKPHRHVLILENNIANIVRRRTL